jgi:hypothetical protein
MTSGSYADQQGPGYFLARICPYSVSLAQVATMEIEIDLTSDWTEYLRSEMVAAGYSVSASDSLDELSYKFFNVCKRRIPDLHRAVHESRHLICPQEHQLGYAALKSKFLGGGSVTPI